MKSLLVANRGEIAVRIIRTARELGIRTIAVYSELDRDALHVTIADEAWSIGGAPAADSYLNAERIISVATEATADAIHPGYGFLAENAKFAQAVIDAGIIWVGPPPQAIATMGDKISSRRVVQKAGVAAVPGTIEPLASAEEIAGVASEFGYPVAVKAAHGGGGKGLRVVYDETELSDAYEGARREAEAYFGNPEVYVEKYLVKPRHIEAQIIIDDHGHAMFLGERDCSVQRRHQKLIEEAPSPVLAPAQRKALGKAAIAVAKSCDYRNAGTVEFLLDQDGRSFYFLEMNTRLQVEHTVTEMTTGIDLVAEQLAVAAGDPLSFDSVQVNGHAIELRINAEDPAKNFMPNPGTVTEYREPSGFGVRVDSWMQPGAAVSQYYDNLIAKLVVWGRDRPEAIRRARRAIDEYRIVGVATTIPAHRAVLEHPTFLASKHHTRFLEDEVNLEEIAFEPGQTLPTDEALARREMTVEVGGRRFEVTYWTPEVAPSTGKTTPSRKPPQRASRTALASGEAGLITAPMQGTIVKVPVKAGESVNADEMICILEAMKMENEVKTPISGEIVDLRVQPGDTVSAGAIVAIVR